MVLPREPVETDGLAFERCDLALVADADASPAARLVRRTADAVVDPADRDALGLALQVVLQRSA